MKLTKNSELLMSFFLNKKCINHVNQTAKTDNILKKLYVDVKNADNYIKSQKQKMGDAFYKLNITKIFSLIIAVFIILLTAFAIISNNGP